MGRSPPEVEQEELPLQFMPARTADGRRRRGVRRMEGVLGCILFRWWGWRRLGVEAERGEFSGWRDSL